ncbi:hypothetical protein HCTV5_165 [Halovirus HCTV-5]|nr:hypothetical protein M200_gp062 [Halovirus HCTV-5]AGM11772.1 hypothetical protein HCTV5_165 [Halovirus HCTV-5]
MMALFMLLWTPLMETCGETKSIGCSLRSRPWCLRCIGAARHRQRQHL